jgi:hypothetical protein
VPDARAIQRLSRPDIWAEDLQLKVDGRPFNLSGREYIRQVVRDSSHEILVKKAAQTAFTVCFLTRTFHWITERRWHHLYLLPLKTGAVPFVQKRIDPMIASNAMLNHKFKSVDNRTHKQTNDDIALLIRGTNVESELQETPTDVVVFDEYDRMTTDWLSDARHRADGSEVKRFTYLSTPTVPGHGLDADEMWWASDQHKWYVPCPHCNRRQSFTLDDNVQLGNDAWDSVLECQFCHKEISDRQRRDSNALGVWSPENPGARKRGYHINQFHSPMMGLSEILENYFLGQRDAKVLKSFFNQSLGEPYTAPGDQITKELLDACIDPAHHFGGIPSGQLCIGIDVGHDEIYVEINVKTRYDSLALYGLHHIMDRPGKTAWEILDEKLLSKLDRWICVCDAHPDKRGANKLSLKYPGKFWMAFERDRPEQEETAKWDKPSYREPNKVIIDRTLAFDTLIHDMMNGRAILPHGARELGEEMPRRDYNGYYSHMIQMVRVEEPDTRGRIVASWQKNNKPDHWHHAKMFSWIASMRRAPLTSSPAVVNAIKSAGSPVGA